MRAIGILILTMVAGCLSTSPPHINDGFYGNNSELTPNSPEEIERMLRQSREPVLQDLLAERTNYSDDVSQVSLGMPKRYVEMYLGSPNQVEVAGNPDYGNEKWTYEMEIPTANGYVTERRFIYFENHTVVGWEID